LVEDIEVSDWNEYERRILAVIGPDDAPRDELLQRWCRHLTSELELPCRVTGIEDFQWEERYLMGAGSLEEYEALQRTQPSYRDVFVLRSIEPWIASEWSMCNEDLKAKVRREADGRRFVLGLSELEVVDRASRNHQLLDDYAVWFVNSR